ncbi:MAG: 50S ribosomal protein L2, partial [Candidatus Diapherotrites archaeon]|nr:50S ribosomal protein L2 [Candidatus Diapherotrites archaeon]
RNGILANVIYEDGTKGFLTAAEGLKVGQQIQIGKNAGIEIGNIAILGNLPEGCPVFAVEKNPGDGGRYARSSGAYALIVTKDSGRVFLKLPSGKMFNASGSARATIGNSASGGRPDKPFVKAGKKYHHMRSKHKKYPKVRGVAMNPISHPFGGAQHHPGKSKSTSRHAAPGRKVGAIASKRTGRRKK